MPLRVSAGLDVGNVELENLLEEFHRTIAVGTGEHPRVHDTTEGRPVRRSSDAIVDHLRDLVGFEAVVKSIEQLTQLIQQRHTAASTRRPAWRPCIG